MVRRRILKSAVVGALLPAATLSSLLVTPSSPAHVPTKERQPLPDTRERANPCNAPWKRTPALEYDLGRLFELWRPAPRDGGATAGGQPTGKARPAPVAEPGPSGEQPNIVVFMVDDMRADELNGPWMRHTRSLIKAQGVDFVNSFSPIPLCGPARASFLTGKYSHNTGVRTNMSPRSSFDQLDDSNTLPVWLQKAGYTNAFLGKYINGYAEPSASRPGSYVPPGWDEWRASLGNGTYNYRKTRLSDNGKGTIDLTGRYQTSAYGEMGSAMVSELAAKSAPFYFNLSFTAPHTGGPHEPDDPGLKTPARLGSMRGKYDDRITTPGGVPGEPCNAGQPSAVSGKTPISPRQQGAITDVRRQRAESLATVDTAVKRVMGALEASGELDNTYVIFTSDNGFFLGEFRQRIGKKLPYEPSLRTPTIVRGPGIEPGIKREQAFSTIDFAPTIADMADARVGANVDGASMLKSATGKAKPWRRPILTDAGKLQGKLHYGIGVRMPGAFYGSYNDRRHTRQLFDISADPHENNNVIGDARYRRVSKTMARMLDRLRDCEGAVCREPWKTSE
ncbi:sulfatase family protein [Solicola gregarius]|uniref:Sulfatase n=1 Tax=Solicola gregarius TaxID=2908642 RepID=A0AA46TMX9_9ACTN|nr:sulfatase [Solicola gregarius]UYM07894.1 sulfatase [Solicola gregarius]